MDGRDKFHKVCFLNLEFYPFHVLLCNMYSSVKFGLKVSNLQAKFSIYFYV